MTELLLPITRNISELNTIISGYHAEENEKAVRIRLLGGNSFWVPKRYINSRFSADGEIMQEFSIETWILKKIGFNFSNFKL